MKRLQRVLADAAPKSFAGQTLAMTISVVLLAQILSSVCIGLWILKPQVERVAGIMAQSIAAASDAADLADEAGRTAIIARLDASEYLAVSPGDTAPPKSGPRPRLLERMFMQALVDSMHDRTELLWRTDDDRQLWIQVRIGPELLWLSAHAPNAMNPLTAVVTSALAALTLSLLAVVLLQRRISQPLETLTDAVQALNPHAAAPPVAVTGPREIVALSQGFNAMNARLAAAEQDRALMLAGVSHDVRTPLAKLRLAIEMLSRDDEALTRAAHAQVEEIDRVLSKFLTFARGFEDEPSTVFNLDALASEVVAMHAAVGVDFALNGAGGDAYGRPEALRRALVNLTENAVRHGAAPFAITLERHAERLDVVVSDYGPGLEPEAAERLCKPFVRDAAAGIAGSGLGLAIAERAALLHDGALRFNRAPDGQFCVCLSLKNRLL